MWGMGSGWHQGWIPFGWHMGWRHHRHSWRRGWHMGW